VRVGKRVYSHPKTHAGVIRHDKTCAKARQHPAQAQYGSGGCSLHEVLPNGRGGMEVILVEMMVRKVVPKIRAIRCEMRNEMFREARVVAAR
jgi:hypothetical protein